MTGAEQAAQPPPGQAAPLLAVRGLAVGYPGAARPVAAGLDLDLHAGELVCLLGPNGAGKSTLLRTLAGLQPPLDGRILWRGEPRPADAQAWARRAAIVLTERVQGGNLTVHDLAALGRVPHTGWTGRLLPGDREAVERALRDAGAWDLRARLYDETSDGEKQKAMLARALAQDPALLLLDEPTAFLDLPRRVEAMRLLRRLARERGRAVLLSTHDLDLALRVADKLWLLSPGGALRCGVPEDLALSGAVGAVFDQGDVSFDRGTGEFRIHGHPRARAVLSGDPDLRFWTGRALEREGYAVATSAEASGVPAAGTQPAARVEVRRVSSREDGASGVGKGIPPPAIWELSGAGGGSARRFASIAELLDGLRRDRQPC